ncbi:WYL domain-containing protein [Labrys neptuniae]
MLPSRREDCTIKCRDQTPSRSWTKVQWQVNIDAKRFVAGWCELREDFRIFRADRIECIELVEERYPGRRRDLAKRWRTQVDEERARSDREAYGILGPSGATDVLSNEANRTRAGALCGVAINSIGRI